MRYINLHVPYHYHTIETCSSACMDLLMNSDHKPTRLPSNLSPTTRECMHLITRGHFWSHDKDGSHHSIRRSLKPHAACKPHLSMFYRSEVMADRSFASWEYICIFDLFCSWDLDLDPMTLYKVLLMRTSPDILDVWKWTFCIKSFKRCHLIDIHTDRYDWNYIPCRRRHRLKPFLFQRSYPDIVI